MTMARYRNLSKTKECIMILRHVASLNRRNRIGMRMLARYGRLIRPFIRMIFAATCFVAVATTANATCPTFHTLTNGTTAEVSPVMDNFNYILGCPNFTGNIGIGTVSPNASLSVISTGQNAVVEPSMISTAKAARKNKTVKYDELTVILINAVQEQQKETSYQAVRIREMRATNAKFEAPLTRIERVRMTKVN